jgi:hypothetical protein
MKAKFTSASRGDNGKVTVQLAQFDDARDRPVGIGRCLLTRDSRLLISIKVGRKIVEVVFAPNRFKQGLYHLEATTAATNGWPLQKPKVGKPVTYEVVGVMYV